MIKTKDILQLHHVLEIMEMVLAYGKQTNGDLVFKSTVLGPLKEVRDFLKEEYEKEIKNGKEN